MNEECPLIPSEEHAIRRYVRITGYVTILLIYGPMGALLMMGPEINGEVAIVDIPQAGCCLMIFVGTPLWCWYRDWQLYYRWPCPRCAGRLKAERRPSVRRNWLLGCSRCRISWDSGQAYVEHRTDSGG